MLSIHQSAISGRVSSQRLQQPVHKTHLQQPVNTSNGVVAVCEQPQRCGQSGQMMCGGRPTVLANAAAKSAGKGFGKTTKKVDVTADPEAPCPCGSGQSHGACCQPFITKQAYPKTPEQLLRSRYTAYTLKIADYIADTTHTESQEYTGSRSSYMQAVRQTMRQCTWLGLNIAQQEQGSTPNEAFITFTAPYVLKDDKSGKRQLREEKSKFWQDPKDKRWYYMDSEFTDQQQQNKQTGLLDIQLPSFKF